MSLKSVRTPDENFAQLPGFDFAPNYLDDLPEYEGLRVHYLDEGPSDASRTFLCLHGQPSWCYLYRKMIPVFTGSGARVIAPDWLGFGRSDKPVDDAVYTFDFHRNMLLAFIQKLDLKNITLVCQDWGGILGLASGPDLSDRLERLLVMNTTLPIGQSAGKGFEDWKAFNRTQPDMDVASLMKRSSPVLSDDEAAAYAAPFVDQTYKAGVRRFPELVMVAPDMQGVDTAKRAAAWWANDWAGKTFMAVGMQDPVLGPPAMRLLQSLINGCPDPLLVEDAGHFVQEWGEEVAQAALKAWGDI